MPRRQRPGMAKRILSVSAKATHSLSVYISSTSRNSGCQFPGEAAVKSVPQNLCSTQTITRPNACDATTAPQQSGVSQKLRAAGTPTANKAYSLKHAANRGSSRRPATPVLMMPRQPKPPLRRSAPTLVRTRRPLPPPASAFRPAEGPIKVTNSKMQANRNSSSRRSRVGVEMTGPGNAPSPQWQNHRR